MTVMMMMMLMLVLSKVGAAIDYAILGDAGRFLSRTFSISTSRRVAIIPALGSVGLVCRSLARSGDRKTGVGRLKRPLRNTSLEL